MSDHLFPPGQNGQSGSNGQDGQSSRYFQDAVTPYSAVSSFNLPTVFDPVLNTPVSISEDSLSRHSSKGMYNLSTRATMDPSPMEYVSTHGLNFYNPIPKGDMKWKNPNNDASLHPTSLTLNTSSDDLPSLSPYIHDSPQTQCPPTPYWGAFVVSASADSTTESTPPTAQNTPHSSMSMPSYVQAPMLTKPTPQTIREKHYKRSYSDDEYHQASQMRNQSLQQSISPLPSQLQTPQPDQSPRQHGQHLQKYLQQNQQRQFRQVSPQYSHRSIKHEINTPPSSTIPSSFTPSIRQASSATLSSTPMPRKRRRTSATPPHQDHPAHRASQSTASPSTILFSNDDETKDFSQASEADLTEDERLLKRLRDGVPRSVSWAETTRIFNLEARKPGLTEPALQMRYKRLKERLRQWKDSEVEALIQVKQAYPSAKWEEIAVRLNKEYNVIPKWSNGYCQKKWAQLHPNDDDGRSNEEQNNDEYDTLEPRSNLEVDMSSGTYDQRNIGLGLGLDLRGQGNMLQGGQNMDAQRHLHNGLPNVGFQQII